MAYTVCYWLKSQGNGDSESALQLSAVQKFACKSVQLPYHFFNHCYYVQSFIYDFRWLAQTSSVQLQEELEANEFEMVAIKNPGKLKNELSTLITTNPQDPKFLKETPKLAKK